MVIFTCKMQYCVSYHDNGMTTSFTNELTVFYEAETVS